ncbi:MAG: hypothetical protein IJ766_05380 [Clostridia bacterium]|nr:hypothetical protein [Clostridia bacterium]
MNILKVWGMRIGVLLVILGVPFLSLGGASAFRTDGVDAVTGASTFAFNPDEVSGEYVIYINHTYHEKRDTVGLWTAFFSGENVPVIMDDISCLVASNDPAGMEYAQICQARLPENQMRIKSVNALLLLSKADYGAFDVIILSKPLVDAYAAASVSENQYITTVYVGGAEV